MRKLLALLPALALTLGALPAHAADQPDTLDVTILGTTDVHGHVYPTNYYGDKGNEAVGLARIYTLVKRERAAHAHTLLVDSGDALQGTPLTYHAARIDPKSPNPMIQAMNAMHYDAFAVGNHEYNYDLPYLNKARSEASFPFLSGNVFKPGTNTPIYTPYLFKNVGGAKIAILGFTTPGIQIWDRRFVQGKQEFRDIVSCARHWIPEVKAKGADAIVVIIHSGLGAPYDKTYDGYAAGAGAPPENVCAALADAFPEIDTILLGHSHKNLPNLVHHGVLMVQADKWGSHLAEVDLKLEKTPEGRWHVVGKSSNTISTADVPPAPEILAATKQAHEGTLAYVHSVIGHSKGAWSAQFARTEDTAIMDLVSEVQRAKTGADLSAVSVLNEHAYLPKGDVTVSDLAGLYVYENSLAEIRITGKQLRAYLENAARYYAPYKPGAPIFTPGIESYNYDMIQGCNYAIDVRKPEGSRIMVLTFHGKPVRDEQTFSLALNSYRQNGGGGYTMIKQAPVEKAVYTEIRQLLIDYVKDQQVIDPKATYQHNWKLLPEGCVAADGEHYK